MSVVSERVEQKLPELHVAAVVSGSMHVGRVVAVDEHFALFVLSENDSLLLRHRRTSDRSRGASRRRHVQAPFGAVGDKLLLKMTMTCKI